MKRLWLTIAALAVAAGPASAQFNTRGTQSYRNALTANNEFGAPRFATTALPTCAVNLGGLAWDTTASAFKVCDASTWAEVGGGIAVGDDNDWTGTQTFLDNKWIMKDGAAPTATMVFLLDDITAGQQSIITVPDADFTLPIISQTLTFSGPSAARTITLPDASFTLAGLSIANVFTAANTFGSAADAANSWVSASNGITFEGATANDFELFLTVADPAASDKTITFPNITGDVVLTAGTQSIAGNKTWTGAQFVNGGWVLESGDTASIGSSSTTHAGFAWNVTQTPDTVVFLVGSLSNAFSFFERTDFAFDMNNGPCATSACTDPSWIVHSHNQSTAQWLAQWHDATNAHLSTGTGGFLGLAYAVEANTGAKTPTLGTESDENGELYTNTGDDNGSSVTLPNDPTVGAVFRIAVTVAQTLTLAPGAGEDLYYEGDECTADTLTSATIGTMLEVVAATGGAGAMWIANGAGWTCNDA